MTIVGKYLRIEYVECQPWLWEWDNPCGAPLIHGAECFEWAGCQPCGL